MMGGAAGPKIRPYRPDDRDAVRALYRAAFPEEDLLGLLDRLAREVPDLCARVVDAPLDEDGERGGVIGHAALTPCRVCGNAGRVALLGPVAVAPDNQGKGLGSALVRALIEAFGPGRILVLGDPGYYGRFGFRQETRIAPPQAIPDAWASAWQGLGGGSSVPSGRLDVPAPWTVPALWTP
ncbi:MAG: GNAT family N-acetyltransferase [Pikeienuella sp.]